MVVAGENRFKGIALPLINRGGLGVFATQTTTELIKSSIQMILQTRLGERVMLPEYGSRLAELLYEPNDSVLVSLAKRFIVDALARWEPRIKVLGSIILANENEMQININYEISLLGVEDSITLIFRREGQ